MAGLGQGDETRRYRAACAYAQAHSTPPRKVSKQCFHLFPKIAEVDSLLRSQPDLRQKLHECHPEVSFWVMNGKESLPFAKKVKNSPNPAGLSFRIGLLEAAGLPVDALHAHNALALGAELDDLIDACAGAWTAKRVADDNTLRFPDPPETDAFGLRICIHA
ncbi:DUF429 domain-containing protein [Xanthobacter sp. TB0139]|uniref:DUF429 domain-containing protein n=1 Tax=Xanthobacter sp. TB0139 TaxID=3459178 RepID=UPI00403971D8